MFWSWIITRHTLNLMSKMRQRRVQPFHTAVRIQRFKSCFQCRVRKDTRMTNWSAIHYWTIVQIRSIMGSYWSFIVVQYANTPIQPSRENRSVTNKWCHDELTRIHIALLMWQLVEFDQCTGLCNDGDVVGIFGLYQQCSFIHYLFASRVHRWLFLGIGYTQHWAIESCEGRHRNWWALSCAYAPIYQTSKLNLMKEIIQMNPFALMSFILSQIMLVVTMHSETWHRLRPSTM